MNGSYNKRLAAAVEAIGKAGHLLIGGGAGLSSAAGLTYGGARFERHFADYADRYGMTDMYSAGFYPFRTTEEKWAYWSRHVLLNRYDPPAAEIYIDLKRLAAYKDSFVITTNVDAQFFKAGFEPARVFAVQGDYGKFQCEKGCHDRLYDNEREIREMIRRRRDFKIPSELVPRCPICGGPAALNLRVDGCFVEDEAWRTAERAYEDFLTSAAGNLTLLELGVGFNTPGIIRYPFETLVACGAADTLIRVNRDEPEAPSSIETRTVSFTEEPTRVIKDLLKALGANSL